MKYNGIFVYLFIAPFRQPQTRDGFLRMMSQTTRTGAVHGWWATSFFT